MAHFPFCPQMRKQLYFDAKQLGMGKAYCERILPNHPHSVSQNSQVPARKADVETDKMPKALLLTTQKGEQECLPNSLSNNVVIPDGYTTATNADFSHIVGELEESPCVGSKARG